MYSTSTTKVEYFFAEFFQGVHLPVTIDRLWMGPPVWVTDEYSTCRPTGDYSLVCGVLRSLHTYAS